MLCVNNKKIKTWMFMFYLCVHYTQPGWYSKFSRMISGLDFTLPDGETMVMLNG